MQHASAQPSVSHAQPSAIDPHSTTRITVHGDQFAAPVRALCSANVDVKLVEAAEKKVVLDVTPKSELPLGPVGLWLATGDGISAPLSLLVDNLPTSSEATDNHSIVTAQSLGLSSAVDGSADGKQFDYFRFHADQGQEITFEVLAQTIGSACDPVVRLLSEDARVLRSIDDDAISPDCRFRHRFENAGNYLIEVHDNRFRAGGRYRLRIGSLPLVAFAYPSVAQRGTCAEIAFAGLDMDNLVPRSINIPDDPLMTSLNLTAFHRVSGAATWTNVELSGSIQLQETEPNNTATEANKLDQARGISGLLREQGDHDCFRFTASKDQTWRFTGRSRSLGSATLLKMALRNAAGDVVAKTAVTDADEPQLDFNFPADGEYVLEVQDLVQRGGPEHGYHVNITAAPAFQIALKPDPTSRNSWSLQKSNGAATLNIQAVRQGYDGPIHLTLEPTVPGLTMLASTIPAGSNETLLTLLSTPEFDPQTLSLVRVVGSAAAAGNSSSDPKATATPTSQSALPPAILKSTAVLVQRAPHQPVPPAWHDSSVTIAGMNDAPALFTWAKIPKAPIAMVRSVADGKIIFNVKRELKDFKGTVTMISSELPAKWSVAAKLEKDVFTLSVKHPVDGSGEGEPQSLKLLFFGEHAGRGQAIENTLLVQLVDPVTVKAVTLKPMVAGESQTATVELTRHALATQPIALRVQNLPAGITATENIMIAPGESKAEVTLTAAADAAAAQVANVLFTATTKVGEQEVSVNSPNTELTVTRP